MSAPSREQRWCLCGWSVFGTDTERINAFAIHRATDEHRKYVEQATVIAGVDAVSEADIEYRTNR